MTLEILTLKVVVIELSVEVLMIIHPSTNHMWVLLCKVNLGCLAMDEDGFIVAEVVCCKSFIAPEHHLTPQVRVLSAFVHSCIWFKILFNVELILFESEFNVFRVGISFEDPVEVLAYSLLLFVESVKVCPFDCEYVLSEQLAEHSSKLG